MCDQQLSIASAETFPCQSKRFLVCNMSGSQNQIMFLHQCQYITHFAGQMAIFTNQPVGGNRDVLVKKLALHADVLRKIF